MLREITNLHSGIKVTKRDLSIMLKGDSQTAVLPLVRVLKPPETAESNQTIPYIIGTAVFKKDKMVGEMSDSVTRGLLWIRNEIKEYTVTFETDEGDGFVSLHAVKADVKLIPKISGDKWMMTIRIRTQGAIVQNGTPMNPVNPKLLNKLEGAFEKDVRERIQLALQEAQYRLNADILGFATAFHRKYPKQWEQNKARWDELFPQVAVNIKVEAQISRPGSVNAPGGMPKDEVIQK